MKTYISLLRGINVSGQKIIRMEALRKLYEGLGFTKVTTYLQSGNVVFTVNDPNGKALEGILSNAILKEFGFEVPILILAVEKLLSIAENNPLAKDPQNDPAFLHVTFLAETPLSADPGVLKSRCAPGEKFELTTDAGYLYCPGGYGNTKLTNTFLESKLKVSATTRNWKTVLSLVELVKSQK